MAGVVTQRAVGMVAMIATFVVTSTLVAMLAYVAVRLLTRTVAHG